MTREFITEVFETLASFGLCRSKTHFSRYWLGREDSYYRNVLSRDGAISFQAQVTLASVLRDDGRLLAQSDKTELRDKGAALIELYSRCIDDLLRRAGKDTYDGYLGRLIEDAWRDDKSWLN